MSGEINLPRSRASWSYPTVKLPTWCCLIDRLAILTAAIIAIASSGVTAVAGTKPSDLEALEKSLGVPAYPRSGDRQESRRNRGHARLTADEADGGKANKCHDAELMCRDALYIIHVKGKREDADELFLRALRLCPTSAQAWFGVGRWLRHQHRIADTLTAFHRAVELDPQLTGAWWSIGTTNADARNMTDSQAAFRQVTKTHPKDMGGMLLVAHAFARLKDMPNCEAAFKRAAAAYPRDPQPWKELASEFMSHGDRSAAEDALGKAMMINPNGIDGLSYTASVKFAAGDLQSAEKILRHILALEPNRYGTWATLSAVMHEKGDKSEELKCARASLRASPTSGSACIAMLKAEMHNGHLKEADQYANKLMTIDSQHAQTWTALGELREAENQPEKAEEAYKRACLLDPADARKIYGLAMFYMRRQLWQKAEDELRVCLKMPSSSMPQAYQALGLVLEKKGDLQAAQSAFQQANKLRPRNVAFCRALTRVLLQLSNTRQAIEAAKRPCNLAPQNQNAWYLLGDVLKECGRNSEAESAYVTGLKMSSAAPAVWNDLGTLYLRDHKAHDAEDCFRKAIALQPDFSKAWSNLGEVLKAQGEKQGALKAYAQALKTSADPGDAYGMAFSLESLGDRKRANQAYSLGLNMTPDEADVLLNIPLVLDDQSPSKPSEVPMKKTEKRRN